jgi:hypothetical protein
MGDNFKGNLMFNVESSMDESQALLYKEEQVIVRNEDSFTSKQTNDYMKDLIAKH